DIARPIRAILKDGKNIQVILDEVISIDKEQNLVNLKYEGAISFDFLILAVGARHSYFGKDHWEKFAPGLKTLNDALSIREKVLLSFEKAEITENPIEREKYLNFVVVGGGPTGVEMAGAISEIARQTMSKDFRHIDPSQAKIYLIEGSDRLLRAFDPNLSDYTLKTLENQMSVNVMLKSVVTDVSEEGVRVGDLFIPTTNIVWAAGNVASPILKTLNVELDKMGRVIVDRDLSIPDFHNIFVIGDASNAKDAKGELLPALAPVATQSGEYIAKIIKENKSKEQRKPFNYFDKGSMATIGRAKAVAHIGKLNFTGIFAWLTWIFVHIMFLIGFRNKVAVMIEWFWFYITGQRSARLI
ncbi:NAD(P)/FAD-dependent oxidoreductase, partial [bacterium]